MSQPTKPAKRGRRTIARHGELKSPHPLSLLLKVLGIIVAVGLVSSAGVAAYAAYDITASFTDDAVDLEGQEAVPPDIGAIEGGVNLVVAGTDECLPEFAGLLRRPLHRPRLRRPSSTTSTCSCTSPMPPVA